MVSTQSRRFAVSPPIPSLASRINSKRRTIGWHVRELVRPSGPAAYVASHHKCASVWTWNLVHTACRRRGIPVRRILDQDRRGPLHLRCCRIVMLMDHRPPNASSKLLAKTPLVHVTRDPRGILASMLRSHRESHPLGRYDMHGEMERSRPLLQGMDDASGYRWLFENSVYIPLVIDSMIRIETIGKPVDRVDFRDITSRPRDTIERILRGIGIPTDDVDSLAEEFAFVKLHRKNPHYRRGDAESWREELPTDIIRDFDARWGRELETLGYPSTT